MPPSKLLAGLVILLTVGLTRFHRSAAKFRACTGEEFIFRWPTHLVVKAFFLGKINAGLLVAWILAVGATLVDARTIAKFCNRKSDAVLFCHILIRLCQNIGMEDVLPI